VSSKREREGVAVVERGKKIEKKEIGQKIIFGKGDVASRTCEEIWLERRERDGLGVERLFQGMRGRREIPLDGGKKKKLWKKMEKAQQFELVLAN